jgi:hypothetical protein
VAERDLAQRGLELVAADAERGQPGLQVVQEGGEAVFVGGQHGAELRDGHGERHRETEDDGDEHEERAGDREPLGSAPPSQQPRQRVDADDEHQCEQDRRYDRRELLQGQRRDEQTGGREYDDEATRHRCPAGDDLGGIGLGHDSRTLSVGRAARTPAGRRRQSFPQGWLASCQMISTSSAMTRIDQKG